jgi:flagellar protein FlaG
MTDPVSALPASPRREPVAGMLPAVQSPKNVELRREAAVVDHVKKTPEATPMQASAALAEINQSLKMASIGVRFEFDKEAHTMIAKVVDVETGIVIRQMPSEEMVRISKALDKLQGLLVRQKV